MRYRHLAFLAFIFIMVSTGVKCQKVSAQDSIWCDNLDNLIRCASLDQILEPVAKDIKDSSYVPSMLPHTRLSHSAVELVGKDHNKVSYMCYLYSTGKPDKNLEEQFNKWYKKVKSCLPQWDDAKLPNSDKTLKQYEDRFFTNSEDETSVRLDIIKGDGYHVRIRIY